MQDKSKKAGFRFEDVIGRMKELFDFQTDAAIAQALGMKPTAFNNRKKADSVPYDEVIAFAYSRNVDLNWLITGMSSQPTEGSKPLPDALPVDMEVLMAVIDELEGALERHRRRLDPARKARAVAVLYEYFTKAGRQEQATVDRILELTD